LAFEADSTPDIDVLHIDRTVLLGYALKEAGLVAGVACDAIQVDVTDNRVAASRRDRSTLVVHIHLHTHK